MRSKHSLYKPKTVLKLGYLWSIYFLKNLLRRKRFKSITPAIFKTQLIHDARRKKFIKLSIRDGVDWTQLEHIFLCEEYDLEKLSRGTEIRELYKSISSSGRRPLIIDCGANIGFATKFFQSTFPNAKLVAVEPDAANMAMAQLNNEDSDVLFYEAAVSSELGSGELIDMGSSNAFRVERSGAGDLDFVTINSILASIKEVTPFIVKIDIEGFESDLFSANTDWIDLIPVMFIELHDWMKPKQGISSNFLKEMSKRNRDFIHYDGYIVSIDNKL